MKTTQRKSTSAGGGVATFAPGLLISRGNTNSQLPPLPPASCRTTFGGLLVAVAVLASVSGCLMDDPASQDSTNDDRLAGCGALYADQSLLPGEALSSCDGRFALALQTDSNLVLYHGTAPLFATNTVGRNAARAVMQADGNFVLYGASGVPLWYTGTPGHPGARLAVQDDGNVVLYDTANRALWATNTGVGPRLPTAPGVYAYGSCRASDPEAKLLDETPPPSSMQAGQEFVASVTFANCSQTTWRPASGHRLGSQAPQDNATWGTARVELPGDVAGNQMVRIDFRVTAPTAGGQHTYRWAIVQEQVRWILNQPSSLRTIDVVAPPVSLCSGVQVDRTGGASASAGIQACLDALPAGGTLELPAGTYSITSPVVIDKPLTLRTTGTATSTVGCLRAGAPSCAVLRATSDTNGANGFVQLVGPAAGVTLDHLVIDGNRAARLGSSAASACAAGNGRVGFNMIVRGAGHRFTHNASINTLCGTALEWHGDQATVVGNTFANNGQHAVSLMWSDGLTLLQSNGAVVTDNIFIDNSDVDLIIGGGTNVRVLRNRVSHSANVSFAGLMLDNFNGSTSGDFRGALVSDNVIDCGPQLCHFGINLGPHAWYLSANTRGGTVTGNTVLNARQGLNIEGAGTGADPIVVYGNAVSGSPASASFLCGVRSTSNYNIGPDVVVDRRGDASPTTNATWHICP